MRESADLQHRPIQHAKWGLFALYAAVVVVGMLVVIWREPVIETPRHPDARAAFEQAAPGITDFAHWERGAIVRASSFHTLRQHHPLFVIDGASEDANELQKWVSRRDDHAPWIEVEMAGRVDVSGVVVSHAGVVENPNLSVKRYEIVCLRDGEEVARQSAFVQLATAEPHDVVCADTDTVRFQFQVGPDQAQDVARIYEVEIYGEPTDE